MQVKYSDVISCLNRCPTAGVLSKCKHFSHYSKVKAEAAIFKSKIELSDTTQIDGVIEEMIERITKLPPGTRFSVGSLVSSASRPLAAKLGKAFIQLATGDNPNKLFIFASMYTGKAIYVRTHGKSSAVQDFDIEI